MSSEKLASDDSPYINKYERIIKSVASEYGVRSSIIAAIISRESSGGRTLVNGWGDNGKAWGLMQVDCVPVSEGGGGHSPRGAWDSREHLSHATSILVDFMRKIKRKFPNWSSDKQLRGGLAAYNKGDGNVTADHDVDYYTTHQNYSKDVMARAQWFSKHGF